MDNKEITYANKVVKDMENRKDNIHDLVIEKYADIASGEGAERVVFSAYIHAIKPE